MANANVNNNAQLPANEEEEESSDTVWQIEEQVVKVKEKTTGKEKEQNLYLWKIDPSAAVTSDFEQPRYALLGLPDPSTGKKRKLPDKYSAFFLDWKTYEFFRCLKDEVPNLKPGSRALGARTWEGTWVHNAMVANTGPNKQLLPPGRLWPLDESHNFADFFDRKFTEGQTDTATIFKDIGVRNPKLAWSVLEGQDWQQYNAQAEDGPPTGQFERDMDMAFTDKNLGKDEAGKDNRTFTARKDGKAFMLKSDVGVAPSADQLYARLSWATRGGANGVATDLMLYDPDAKRRGLTRKDIFVPVATMDLLKAGNYKWTDNGDKIMIRDNLGKPNFIRVPPNERTRGAEDLSNRDSKYWIKAWNAAVARLEGKSVRSRNVRGLDLLFIVRSGARITAAELETMVVEVKKKSETRIPIQQTAKVVDALKADAEKKEFNYLLSTSPFGDFQTWIREKDFMSYLKEYPGRELPKTAKAAQDAFSKKNLERGKTALENNAEYQAKLKKQLEAVDKILPKQSAGVVMSTVSISTVANATASDRKTVPGQGDQMGGSATAVAKDFGWKDYDKSIGAAEALPLRWDSPGVRPSEWLHRCAYSWGNDAGVDVNQWSNNFVFGSSEANSLMTRFEKAWQTLFRRERSIRNELKEAAPLTVFPPFEAHLITINTSIDRDFSTVELSTDGKSIVETVYSYDLAKKSIHTKTSSRSNGVVTVTKETDTPLADANCIDYWDLAAKNPNLSFSLDYTILIPQTSLGQPFGMHSTMFYPFQRGFFTRLEADIDQALLDRWAKTASDAIPKPMQISTNTVRAFTRNKPIMLSVGSNAPVGSQPASGDFRTATIFPSISTNTGVTSDTALSSGPVSNLTSIPAGEGGATKADDVNPDLRAYQEHKETWRRVVNSEPLHIGDVQLHDAKVVTADDVHLLGALGIVDSHVDGHEASGEVRAMSVRLPRFTSLTPGPSLAFNSAAIISKVTAVTSAPQPASPPVLKPDTPMPDGFTLQGKIKLFGLIDADMYSFHGSSTRQIIPLNHGKTSIADYLPDLAGTIFDDVGLRNARLVYNAMSSSTELAGTWLDTEMVFKGNLDIINDALRNVFNQKDPRIRLQALLSAKNDWSNLPLPPALCLRGSLPNVSVKIGELVEFIDLGVSVMTGRVPDPKQPDKFTSRWGFGFNGRALLHMPSDLVPLELAYSVTEFNKIFQLQLASTENSVLSKFAGIDGLTLSNFSISTTFTIDKSPALASFNASASFRIGVRTLNLSGYYTPTDWSFLCQLEDFDFQDLCDMYAEIFGPEHELHLTEHEIVLDNLVFCVGLSGISISGKVTIEGHTSVAATIALDRLGLTITGSLDGDIELADHFKLEHAGLKVFIGRAKDTTVAGAGTSWSFAIEGKVGIFDDVVEASLFLGKDPKLGTIWTVYGGWQTGFRLSKIAKGLAGTELDLELKQVALIVSNVDGLSAAGPALPAAFTPVAGFQIAAVLDNSPILGRFDQAMNNKSPTTGLTLQAAYMKTSSSFRIGIRLPAAQQVSMKDGSVYSGDVFFGIEFGDGGPVLVVTADFFVKVPDQLPLQFQGGFKLDAKEAKASLNLRDGQMWWNPFGLCKDLALGPRVGVELGVVYVGPGFTAKVAAGLKVGKGEHSPSGEAALGVSEIPSEELLVLDVKELGITDLVDFASLLLQQTIPQPGDFLRFKHCGFYLSGGTSIGQIVYPPGASFACDAVIFGTEAQIDVAVDKRTSGVMAKGSVDAFTLGPLSISGTVPGTKAKFDIELSAGVTGKQQVLIDGKVVIAKLDALLHVEAQLLPPSFLLHTALHFSDLVMFDVVASMKAGSFKDVNQLHSLEFHIDVLMVQSLMDHIATSVTEEIKYAQKKADEGIHNAEVWLAAEKVKWEKDIEDAKAGVTTAEASLKERVDKLANDLAREQSTFHEGIKKFGELFDAANKKFQDLCTGLSNDLQAALDKEAQLVAAAKQEFQDSKSAADKRLNDALGELQKAEDDMQRRFGDAINNLHKYEQDVKDASSARDDAWRDVESAQRDYDNCEWWSTLYYSEELGRMWLKYEGIKTGLDIAEGFLKMSEDIVNAADYVSQEGIIAGCKETVRTTRIVTDGMIENAQKTLDGVINLQAGYVRDARAALEKARNASDELVKSNDAKKILDDFRKKGDALIQAASDAVRNIGKEAVSIGAAIARNALEIAQRASVGFEAAKYALETAQAATDTVLDLAAYVVKYACNILNIRVMRVQGDLRGLCEKGTKLDVHLEGTIAQQDVIFDMHLTPGDGKAFIKELFRLIVEGTSTGTKGVTAKGVEGGKIGIVHRDGWVPPPPIETQEQRNVRAIKQINDTLTVIESDGEAACEVTEYTEARQNFFLAMRDVSELFYDVHNLKDKAVVLTPEDVTLVLAGHLRDGYNGLDPFVFNFKPLRDMYDRRLVSRT